MLRRSLFVASALAAVAQAASATVSRIDAEACSRVRNTQGENSKAGNRLKSAREKRDRAQAALDRAQAALNQADKELADAEAAKREAVNQAREAEAAAQRAGANCAPPPPPPPKGRKAA